MAWLGMSPAEHFRSRYRIDPATGCWIWLSGWSYPQIRIDNVTCRATHLALELDGRPVPKGKLVCHRCDNPLCVNPAHLFIGTQKDNIQDAIGKGRFIPKGSIFDWTGRKHTPETREKMRLVALKREATKRNANRPP